MEIEYTSFDNADIAYYKDGKLVTGSNVIGYESSVNRVVRAKFTTGELGATKVSILIDIGRIQHDTSKGIDLPEIPFYITTSEDSHVNANVEDGYAVTGYITGDDEEKWNNIIDRKYEGSADIVLLANTTYYIWFFPVRRKYGWSYWNKNSSSSKSHYAISGISKFGLHIEAGDGSSITVNRTVSIAGAPTGNIDDSADIYKDDQLKIVFTPDYNHLLKTHTVNDSDFTSGNMHTVSGDVHIKSTAQVSSSNVGATDANIGSISTITVTKYNGNYYHTLQYEFGSLSGYITSSGAISSTPVRFSNISIPFALPDSFYNEIPNAKSGKCKITCITYGDMESATPLGDSTECSFTATAAESLSKPTIEGRVVDAYSTTRALTGDENVLIRYKSTAQCTITVRPNNGASISTKSINGSALTGNIKNLLSVDTNVFEFAATDSRGYTNSATVNAEMVAYIALTCNPILRRKTPTSSEIVMDVSGNMYRGSFGAHSNSLTLKYRYKERGGSYGDWIKIEPEPGEPDLLTFGLSSYRSTNEIKILSYPTIGETGSLERPGFDYRLDYDFQIRAIDGSGNYELSTVDKYVTVNRGIPVFDWGENDFNVNVDFMLNNTNILDIIYPVGSIYINTSNTLPPVISNIGKWDSAAIGIVGMYAWERTG